MQCWFMLTYANLERVVCFESGQAPWLMRKPGVASPRIHLAEVIYPARLLALRMIITGDDASAKSL